MNEEQRKGAQLRERVAIAGEVHCLIVAVFLTASCGSVTPAASRMETYEAQRRTDYVVRELREEATALRAEMAATRIAAAKKEAEFQELRRQVPLLIQESAEAHKAEAQLRQAKAEQQQAFDAKQTELTALRSERDQLREAKLELQTQAVQLPPLRDALAQARAAETTVQGRVKELELSVASLTSDLDKLTGELEQVRKGLAGNRGKSAVKPGKPASAHRSPLPAKSEATSNHAPSPAAEPASRLISAPASQDRPGHHIVAPGDTLGTLAWQYGVTVEELKTANGLQSEVIRVGQRLTIPVDGLPSLHLSP